AADDVGFDECPRRMANRPDRLAAHGERAHELDDLGNHPELIRVERAPGKEQRVECLRIRLLDLQIDVEGLAAIEVPKRLDLACLRRDEHRLRARSLERVARLGELHLLDAVGGENGNGLAVELLALTAGFLRLSCRRVLFHGSSSGARCPPRPCNGHAKAAGYAAKTKRSGPKPLFSRCARIWPRAIGPATDTTMRSGR